jgi:hypothetical protein
VVPTQAENSFGQLLRINPQSVTVLRAYAQFLLEVVNHDSKASIFFCFVITCCIPLLSTQLVSMR